MSDQPSQEPRRAVVVDDERMLDLVDVGEVAQWLGGDAAWSEGPVYLPVEDAVIWSDIPGNRILRWDAVTGEVSTHRSDVEFTNGRTLDLEGRVVACSHGRRGLERTERPRLRHRPPRGGPPGEREYGDHHVFRYDPATAEVTTVVLDVEEPNGLAFSPDERLLYVSDTAAAAGLGHFLAVNHHIRVYDVVHGRYAKSGRVFAEVSPGVPDGFRVDVHGNVWTSSATRCRCSPRTASGWGRCRCRRSWATSASAGRTVRRSSSPRRRACTGSGPAPAAARRPTSPARPDDRCPDGRAGGPGGDGGRARPSPRRPGRGRRRDESLVVLAQRSRRRARWWCWSR